VIRSDLIDRLECERYGTRPPAEVVHDISELHEDLVRLVMLVDSVVRGLAS